MYRLCNGLIYLLLTQPLVRWNLHSHDLHRPICGLTTYTLFTFLDSLGGKTIIYIFLIIHLIWICLHWYFQTAEHSFVCYVFRYVIECPNCGVIYRSRQYWYGNQDPVETVVRTEIQHVWPGVREAGTARATITSRGSNSSAQVLNRMSASCSQMAF